MTTSKSFFFLFKGVTQCSIKRKIKKQIQLKKNRKL